MRWLHISDIHFGYDSAAIEKMREKLIQNAKDIGPVDCLFITGDLRYGKTECTAYPSETLTFIQRLQTAFGVKPENTFVVPGNHDVNRSDVLEAGIEKAAQKYKTSDGAISEETLAYIRGQRKPFLDLYKEICGREEPDWHYCIPKDGFNIICLNTALFCCKDGEDGSLVVGSRLLNKLVKEVDSSLPGIVLAHHDFDALRQDEQRELEQTLKEMGAVLYLCGHKHVALSHTQCTYQENWELNVFLCGTSMDKDPNLEQTDMDILIGQIDETGQKGFVKAYKWNYDCHDWLPDLEFSYPQNGATDGIRYFPADARPQTIERLNEDILEKYRQYICAQCGKIELNGLPTNQEDICRTYALERIFVPVNFQEFKGREEESDYEESDAHLGTETDRKDWIENYRRRRLKITLGELIPSEGVFRRFILSDPGGGKTTLLKRIASVYSAQEDCDAVDKSFPQRELFPVWIRCRDIPAGSRLSVWNTIENVVRLGEWAPGDSATEDFINLVSYHIKRGTALLLIDGLDEIGNDVDCQHFADQLSVFASANPSVNMIVTTRITGFPMMTQERFTDFEKFEILPLQKQAIKNLCVKWYYIVYGESKKSRNQAEELAERITDDERILRLARNPLLLTTLLLVERRVGKLPTKRTALYDEAIQVLLETWNQAGHENEKVDLEEARYQLSYAAFYMTVNHLKQIGKTQLHSQIRTFRQEFSELVSKKEPIAEFIQKIERRSALLIQKGYKIAETGGREAIYEFQHLTFQEYLAAYAVAEGCCPGASGTDSCGMQLKPHLKEAALKETVALVAMLKRQCAKEFADEIMKELSSGVRFGETHNNLRALLLQFVADEVQVKDDVIDKIFAICFKDTIQRSDLKMMRQILGGRYRDRLYEYFSKVDREKHEGYVHNASLLLILSGEITDPYQYYIEHRCLPQPQQQTEGLATLANAIWVKGATVFQKVDRSQLSKLQEELFAFVESDDRHVRREALLAVRFFLDTAEDVTRYIDGCVRYINDFSLRPPNLRGLLLMRRKNELLKIEAVIRADSGAFQKVYESFQKKEMFSPDNYGNLLGFALILLIVGADSERLGDVFALIKEEKEEILRLEPLLFEVLLHKDYSLFESLQQVLLLTPSRYTEAQKRVVQEYILNTDLRTAREMKQRMEAGEDDGLFAYNDCSLLDGSEFTLSCKENSLAEVIEYITKRLEVMGGK